MASLTVEHIQLRDARWVIVDSIGKGGRVRSVPMPSWTKAAIEDWTASTGITTGLVFRAVNKGGRITGASRTPQAVFELVRQYGVQIAVRDLAPHDFRRTVAKLAQHQPVNAVDSTF